MRLSPAVLNAHLAHLGQRCAWRRAFACPCVNLHSGAARGDCPQCQGKGRIWADPVAGMAGLSGQKATRDWFTFGVAEMGDVVLSLPSDSALYAMGQFDRVILSDSSQPFSLTLIRGQNDRLRFPVVAVDRVFWLTEPAPPIGSGPVQSGGNPLTVYAPQGAIVEGGIPTVATNGALSWTSGEPPAGRAYTITGRQRPEYFCYGEFPSDRAHHGGLPLPRRVVLRKFDLYGR